MTVNDETNPDLEFRKRMVKERFGHRLDPAEWEEVEEAVSGIHRMVHALRAVEIKNSDEPFVKFSPYLKKD